MINQKPKVQKVRKVEKVVVLESGKLKNITFPRGSRIEVHVVFGFEPKASESALGVDLDVNSILTNTTA